MVPKGRHIGQPYGRQCAPGQPRRFSTVGAGLPSAEPTWDEVQMAWVLDEATTVYDGDPPTPDYEHRYSAWVQFRGPEGPQPTPEGATEFEYRVSTGMTAFSEDDPGVSDLDFDYACSMVVEYLETGFAMDGLGAAEISASVTGDDGSENMNLTMSYGLDLLTQLDGCPSGTAYVQLGQYRTDVAYDGQGSAAWTLTGPNYNADGTVGVPCGPIR